MKQVEAPAKQDHFRWCSASETVNTKTLTAISNKTEFDTVCKGWVFSTLSIVFPTSALKNVHVVTWKLDLDQMSVAPTPAENIDKTNFFNGKTVPVVWGLVPEYFFVAGTTCWSSQQSSGGSDYSYIRASSSCNGNVENMNAQDISPLA